jgi:hypothetical protein
MTRESCVPVVWRSLSMPPRVAAAIAHPGLLAGAISVFGLLATVRVERLAFRADTAPRRRMQLVVGGLGVLKPWRLRLLRLPPRATRSPGALAVWYVKRFRACVGDDHPAGGADGVDQLARDGRALHAWSVGGHEPRVRRGRWWAKDRFLRR